GMYGVYTVAFDSAGALYAGIYGGIWKLPANSQPSDSWQDAGAGLPASAVVLTLAFDGAGNLLAGIERQGMFRLPAGGTTWAAFNDGAASDLPTNQLIQDSAGHIWAATKSLGILKLAAGSVNWVSASGGLAEAGVTALLTSSDGSLLAASANGVFSANAAGVWTPNRSGLPVESVINALVFDAAGHLYAASDSAGVARLSVGASTWQDWSSGAPASGIAKSLVIDPTGNLYAAFFGPGVYRLAAGGSTWVAINNGLTNYPVVNQLSVAANGDVYAAATAIGAGSANGVYRLLAGSTTWTQLGGALPNDPPLRTLAVDADGTVYAGASAGMTNSGTFGGVYRLLPGQSTWTAFNTGMDQREIFALALDTAGNLYAVASGAVFVLNKGATSWTDISGGLPTSFFGYAHALRFDATGQLLMGTSDGIFMLPAGATQWQTFATGLPARPVFALAVSGARYAVGTSGAGVYASAGLPFGAGWNLLGNSTDQAINPVTLFGDKSTPTALSADIVTVWTWDAGQKQWAFFTPAMSAAELTSYADSKGYLVLQTIAPRRGFWLNGKNASALPAATGNAVNVTATDLVTGWNLMSDARSLAPSAFHASLGSAAANYITLWAWDAANTAWLFHSPALEAEAGTKLVDYINSKGYLDFSATGRTLAPGTGFWVNRP
ncbi:MAG: hypothetical protein PHH58_06225, partial [Rhodoferax sp.]|nr:hypothetical protein [Rhodoferax sp.]